MNDFLEENNKAKINAMKINPDFFLSPSICIQNEGGSALIILFNRYS